ncbi:MAG: endo alpha-1,4 polygalactosaminidase [Sphingobacteriales bacterium JAD_PAG50586_3]|nr:MAG: endo alpha-1,4 polygalactosaminidase [Sphingobacteriales bacterium JAD_PAG50586_3]
MKKSFVVVLVVAAFAAKAQLTSLQNINAWAYQLQNVTPAAIAPDNSFQLFVTDYSADGSGAGVYTPQQVQAMKTGGKKVIAYISIGEAENYRDYWQPTWNNTPPVWLGSENPDWAGNYKVKFWHPQWKNIIYTYIDTILAKGYDGIYMDIIDAYYYWQEENPQEPYADTLMVDFISDIRHHADSVLGNSAFILIPQNAEDIIDANNITVALQDKYFNSINAIGVEDVFFPGNNDINNAHAPDTYRTGLLTEFKNSGKRVFSIEYIDQPTKLTQYVADVQANQYVPYACYRPLDMICTQLPLAVEETELPKPVIYTNAGTLTVITPYHASVDVIDMQGRVVGQQVNTTYSQWPGLNPGLYLIIVKSGGKQLTYKHIIQ